METEVVLETNQLKKYFGAVKAVEDISLSVKRAEIYGFLGPNGSGKTTTISMILGLMRPTAGEVKVFGETVTPEQNSVLKRVGMMVGAPALLPPFTARQNLQMMATMHPDLPESRIDETLKLVDLYPAADRKAKTFSMGMKQRLGIALALLNKPELLILDEPTNGMDPAGMHEIRQLLRSLSSEGITIFLSSHLMHEIEQVCDRVAVVQKGSMVAQGTIAELLSGDPIVSIHTNDTTGTVKVLEKLENARSIETKERFVYVQGIASSQVIEALVQEHVVPEEVSVTRPDLESVFLSLTK
ncbi:ABC transporter ATP-binding protein [Dictyobacter alpinus]|uniref:ABC transporter ATP-binding protein n=1 Tax=Dictyobacter alpinus TaxID=2014873 RepID=A0A402BBA6_9CHLR|nr:ABC transporter ATP-binding protein [Dictyobacter alpinus]GCE28624.1 ABC transporter ATP-binding protein [Dictyobacter alpinus]